MFRLPDITYPLTIDTVGKMLAMGNEVSVSCLTTRCGHRGRINLVQYAKRHGMDAPCLAKDMTPHFHCSRCRAARRPDRNIMFTYHVLTAQHCVIADRGKPDKLNEYRKQAKGG